MGRRSYGAELSAKERRPFTLAEQRAILTAAQGDRFVIIVVLAHATGLRQSELLARIVEAAAVEH